MKRSYLELFDSGRQALRHIPDGEGDARRLLLWVFETDMNELLKHYTDEVERDPQAVALYEQAVGLRAQHVPLQYITGRQYFMGLPMMVDGSVLIPRQDTEVLAELVLEECPDARRVLDLCTGSGCLAVALKLLSGYELVCGADISREALKLADANARLNGAQVLFYESDMFSRLQDLKDLDVIVCNPPYIRRDVIPELMSEVRDFEPRIALDGGEDGLDYYRILAAEAGEHLRPGGRMYLEIGYDQAGAVTELLERHHFKEIKVTKDLAGLDRVISCSIT